MAKRLTYEYVKEQIENSPGYKLLSKEYKGNKSLLSVQCPKNHIFQIRWNDFQRGVRCRKCANIKQAIKRRHELIYVKQKLKEKGFTLLSDNYNNNKSKLILRCSNNHEFKSAFSDIMSGHGCVFCYRTRQGDTHRHSFEYVKSFIEETGYKLLSTSYKNSCTKLFLKCDKNHDFSMTFDDFRSGYRCRKCFNARAGESQRHSFEYVKSFIEKIGYELLSKTYKNSSQKLWIRCDKKHKFRTSFALLQRGTRCLYCAKAGFRYDKPAFLYYIKVKINDNKYYKIGITNKNIEKRIKQIDSSAKLLWSESYLFGEYAYKEEQKILKKYSKFLANDLSLPIKSGHTELFTKDVLKKDKSLVNKVQL